MNVRLALALIAGFLVLLLVGALYVQTIRYDAAASARDEAREQLASANRATVELAANAAATELRNTIARSGREAIIAAPVSDDAPISPVLRRGLQTADEIGGFK